MLDDCGTEIVYFFKSERRSKVRLKQPSVYLSTAQTEQTVTQILFYLLLKVLFLKI